MQGTPQGKPVGAREFLTPTWRFWLMPGSAPAEADMLYITAAPDTFDAVCDLLVPMLEEYEPAAVRLVREARVLDAMNDLPEWTGKAITCYLAEPGAVQPFARAVDALLAGSGLHGPPVLRARPFGGPSGMVFLRASGADREGGGRQGKLARLLGGT